jgi:hypothetical protein
VLWPWLQTHSFVDQRLGVYQHIVELGILVLEYDANAI